MESLTAQTRCLVVEFKLLALDTSTRHTGFALFEHGKLVKQGVFNESADDIDKRIKAMINRIYTLIRVEKPNLIVFEDVRIQKSAHTTVALSKILGAIIGKCIDINIQFECLAPASWRAKHGIQKPGIKRDEFKRIAIDLVREKYNSDVSDDEAEAILIGASWYM